MSTAMRARTAITSGSRVVVSKHQVATQLGSELIILGAEAGQYFGLKEVGARIWELVQRETAVSELCHAIQSEYAVEAGQCEADVLELLHELADKGLIHVLAGSGNR